MSLICGVISGIMGGHAAGVAANDVRRRREWCLAAAPRPTQLGPERQDGVDPRFQLEEAVYFAPPSVTAGMGGGADYSFQTRDGSYNTASLIQFLADLKRELRAQNAVLLWDGLPAHKSREMNAYLRQQRHWLVVERLPGYAPDLNPVETLWGNVKGQELANRCATDLAEVDQAVRGGMARVRRSRVGPHRNEEVDFKNGDVTLHGALTSHGPGSPPVVICAASGGHWETASFDDLAGTHWQPWTCCVPDLMLTPRALDDGGTATAVGSSSGRIEIEGDRVCDQPCRVIPPAD